MNVVKYNVVNKIINKSLPYYNDGILTFPVENKYYEYFLECSLYDKEEKRNIYYILLGKSKFDENCRKCKTNGYGKVILKPKGDIKEYIESLCEDTKNIDVTFIENEGDYDTYRIGE